MCKQVLIGAGADRFGDMDDVVFGRTVDDHGFGAERLAPQRTQKFDARHRGHVPIEQDGVGHVAPAEVQSRRSVFGFIGRKLQLFQNLARDFPENPAVIDDQALLHDESLPVQGSITVMQSGKYGLKRRARSCNFQLAAKQTSLGAAVT